jgi:hypothetical protein
VLFFGGSFIKRSIALRSMTPSKRIIICIAKVSQNGVNSHQSWEILQKRFKTWQETWQDF